MRVRLCVPARPALNQVVLRVSTMLMFEFCAVVVPGNVYCVPLDVRVSVLPLLVHVKFCAPVAPPVNSAWLPSVMLFVPDVVNVPDVVIGVAPVADVYDEFTEPLLNPSVNAPPLLRKLLVR